MSAYCAPQILAVAEKPNIIFFLADWKGVRTHLGEKGNSAPDFHIALYNLKMDVAESKDVSAQHLEIIAGMEKLLREQHVASKEFPYPALDKMSGH